MILKANYQTVRVSCDNPGESAENRRTIGQAQHMRDPLLRLSLGLL